MLPQTTDTADQLAILYGQDYALWLDATCRLLKAGRLSDLDLSNLREELEDMGHSEKQALVRNGIVVLIHLLKHAYQPQLRSNIWRFTLKEHRRRIQAALQTSPSLKLYLDQMFAECYREARDLAATETGLSLETFPEVSPFSLEQALDREFLPN